VGWEPLPEGSDLDHWVSALLGLSPEVELIAYTDPGRGDFRFAGIVNDRLEVCLFLAPPAGALPMSDGLASALGSEISPAMRRGLLAGGVNGRAAADDSGAICACFAVGRRAVRRAIAERGLASLAEIGAMLGAGTNCGSCLPELQQILRSARRERAPAT
jgi:assimilatory nitrate reductase catalytic subunit